jgi:hypothetical protein
VTVSKLSVALTRAAVLVLSWLVLPGCLVLNLNPAYDDESLAWEPALLGRWQNTEDNVSVEITRGEWKSYKIHYVHPIETGDLTGYLTLVGDERYLDVMPARGQDRGSFVIPVHAVLRIRLHDDRLEVAALSYDWFFDMLKAGKPIAGLGVSLDQKENALIVSPTGKLRAWLRTQAPDSPVFGAVATFNRQR